jgi:hypothetical protein
MLSWYLCLGFGRPSASLHGYLSAWNVGAMGQERRDRLCQRLGLSCPCPPSCPLPSIALGLDVAETQFLVTWQTIVPFWHRRQVQILLPCCSDISSSADPHESRKNCALIMSRLQLLGCEVTVAKRLMWGEVEILWKCSQKCSGATGCRSR